MAEAALTPRTHLLLYYSLRNIPVFLSMRVLTEVSQRSPPFYCNDYGTAVSPMCGKARR